MERIKKLSANDKRSLNSKIRRKFSTRAKTNKKRLRVLKSVLKDFNGGNVTNFNMESWIKTVGKEDITTIYNSFFNKIKSQGTKRTERGVESQLFALSGHFTNLWELNKSIGIKEPGTPAKAIQPFVPAVESVPGVAGVPAVVARALRPFRQAVAANPAANPPVLFRQAIPRREAILAAARVDAVAAVAPVEAQPFVPAIPAADAVDAVPPVLNTTSTKTVTSFGNLFQPSQMTSMSLFSFGDNSIRRLL